MNIDLVREWGNNKFCRTMGSEMKKNNINKIGEFISYLETEHYYLYSDEEYKFLYEFFKSDFSNECMYTYLENEMSKLNIKKQGYSCIAILNDNQIANHIKKKVISLVEDIELLCNNLDLIESDESKKMLFKTLPVDKIAKYIEKYGEKSVKIFEFINGEGKWKTIDLLGDVNKLRLISTMKLDEDSIMELQYGIKDIYYKIQISMFIKTGEKYNLESHISEYESQKKKLQKIEDEHERACYIASLKENDMKRAFLESIEMRENRDIIIQSLHRNIDERIRPQVELVNTMIREFLRDNNVGEKKEEQCEIALNKEDVFFESLESKIGGLTVGLDDRVNISERYINIKNAHILGILLHEYAHVFANLNYKIQLYRSVNMEEGMADLFAELVINHYIKKHGNVIEIDGSKIKIEYPFLFNSAYYKENACIRTMIYPLEQEGKDIEAICEYLLGDKFEFYKSILDEQTFNLIKKDIAGNMTGGVTIEENKLYLQNKNRWENVDRESIYYRGNFIIPAFEMQSKLNIDETCIFGLPDGEKSSCVHIGKKFFQNRKLYEIPKEELEEFIYLYQAQMEMFIDGYYDFANLMNNELDDEEIKQHPFEILENSTVLWNQVYGAGINLEQTLIKAMLAEKEKISKGQGVDISCKKYTKLINQYISIFSKSTDTTNCNILSTIKDLQFAYLTQIREAIEADNVQGVINGLTDEISHEFLADEEIYKIFEETGVQVTQTLVNGKLTSQIILDGAKREKLKLNDVENSARILDDIIMGKDSKKIENR